MAEAPLSLDLEYFPEFVAGRPLAGGFVYIGTEKLDPEILTNRVGVLLLQSDGTKVTIAPAAQPLTIGSGGVISYLGSPAFIRVTGTVSVKVTDSTGSQIYYNPTANVSADAALNEGVIVQNGSFENETIVAGLPDNWTTNPGTNGAVAIDATSQAHGLKSLKFTGTDATGGGTATSDKFNVLENADLDIRFTYKSSAVDTLNKVDIKYYDASGSALSTSSILSEGAANPITYTSYIFGDIAPSSAVQAEIILTGVDGTGTTTVGTTNFDDITESFSPNNSVIKTIHVASGVNDITATGAATGNKPSINQTGADNVGMDIEGVELKNGVVTGDVVGNLTGIASSVAASSVGQNELKRSLQQTTGTTGGNLNDSAALTGGTYSLGWSLSSGTTGGFTLINYPVGNYAMGVGWKETTGSAQTYYFQSRYITASPPYDIGDGDIPLFVFARIDNATGTIEAVSSAPEAPWHYNGPTKISSQWKDSQGLGHRKICTSEYERLINKRSLKDLLRNPGTRSEAIALIEDDTEHELVIDQDVKNADMNLIPHPFLNDDLTGKTVVLLDPVSKLVEQLYMIHESEEDSVSTIVHENLIYIGNTGLNRVTPSGVMVVSANWKNTNL